MHEKVKTKERNKQKVQKFPKRCIVYCTKNGKLRKFVHLMTDILLLMVPLHSESEGMCVIINPVFFHVVCVCCLNSLSLECGILGLQA